MADLVWRRYECHSHERYTLVWSTAHRQVFLFFCAGIALADSRVEAESGCDLAGRPSSHGGRSDCPIPWHSPGMDVMVDDGVRPGEEEGLELRHQNQAGWTAVSRGRHLQRTVPRGNLATWLLPDSAEHDLTKREQGQKDRSRQTSGGCEWNMALLAPIQRRRPSFDDRIRQKKKREIRWVRPAKPVGGPKAFERHQVEALHDDAGYEEGRRCESRS